MRVMALDVGERRIGVAVSDELGWLARTVTVIEQRDLEVDLDDIQALVAELGAELLVVGYPRSMSGEIGEQAQRMEEFVEQLQPVVGVPIVLWDERLTTFTATQILREQGVDARAQKKRIDAVAAAVILQDYLDAQAVQRRQSIDQEENG